MSQAQEPVAPSQSEQRYTTTDDAWYNDLEGVVQGRITFAQTHVTNATRKIFDPPLVPGREALVIFQQHPFADIRSVDLVVRSAGRETTIAMTPPESFPDSRKYDEDNVYSGKHIVGDYPKYAGWSYTATLPYDQVQPDMELKFVVNNDASKSGTLPASKMVFLNNQSEGLVLMNIKGCAFREQSTCRTTLDQYDMQKNPELAKIAAREMFSELPVKQLVLGMGESYWPYVIAIGPDGKPHRYSTSNRNYREWAAFGDLTLSAKLGMGNFWRAASDLGNKKPGKFVAISGQLLDVPDDIPSMPPGVGASCSGNSCNYPYYPGGFWHEVGHGLGLPHSTPPRYEGWAWRSYDLNFLPNYHPAPQNYGLGTDHLGFHYFGHIVGSLGEPGWPESTASAPLIDEFEQLRRQAPAKTADWKHYVAPFTHQQILQVQRRFGSFPAQLRYARLNDDHRQPPAPPLAEGVEKKSDSLARFDTDTLLTPQAGGELFSLVEPGQQPVLKGVPVHTLVVTLADRSHDSEGISQIYPAIVSNYGNVFASGEMFASGQEHAQYSDGDGRSAADDDYVLEVQFANASVARWHLFSGAIPTNVLPVTAINVSSADRPNVARLLRNAAVIHTRQLSAPDLPAPITVGAEKGYPIILPALLKSEATGKCLMRRADVRVDQVTCDPGNKDQQWGFSPVLGGTGRRTVITGPDDTASCLQWPLRLKRCEINSPDFQWAERKDLAPEGIKVLQNVRDGTFITAAADGHSVNLQGLTHGADQQFRPVVVGLPQSVDGQAQSDVQVSETEHP